MRPFLQEELKRSLRNRRLMTEDSWLCCWGERELAVVLAPTRMAFILATACFVGCDYT